MIAECRSHSSLQSHSAFPRPPCGGIAVPYNSSLAFPSSSALLPKASHAATLRQRVEPPRVGRPGVCRRRQAAAAQPQREPLSPGGPFRPHRLDRRPDVERQRSALQVVRQRRLRSRRGHGPALPRGHADHRHEAAQGRSGRGRRGRFRAPAGRGRRQAGAAAGRNAPRHGRSRACKRWPSAF